MDINKVERRLVAFKTAAKVFFILGFVIWLASLIGVLIFGLTKDPNTHELIIIASLIAATTLGFAICVIGYALTRRIKYGHFKIKGHEIFAIMTTFKFRIYVDGKINTLSSIFLKEIKNKDLFLELDNNRIILNITKNEIAFNAFES